MKRVIYAICLVLLLATLAYTGVADQAWRMKAGVLTADGPVAVGTGGLSTTGTFSVGTTVLSPDEIYVSATAVLTAAKMAGGIANNYGQTVENTQTLPAAAANLWKTFVVGTAGAGAFHIKAGAGDKIYLNGTALDDGDKVSDATPSVGDYLTCRSFKTGASAWDWICTSGAGTWTDGGA